MQILGELSKDLPHVIAKAAVRMAKAKGDYQIAIIVFRADEIASMKKDFHFMVQESKWKAPTPQILEKAELMHMIGTALLNCDQAEVKWFRSYGKDIYKEATEFDEHSQKLLLTSEGKVYILLAYNGRWVGGKGNNDQNQSTESYSSLD
jgi:hypothetical protein